MAAGGEPSTTCLVWYGKSWWQTFVGTVGCGRWRHDHRGGSHDAARCCAALKHRATARLWNIARRRGP